MRTSQPNPRATSLQGRFAATLLALLCFGPMLGAPSADAAFEQVGTFAGSPTPVSPPFAEEVQLGGAIGMAVNHTGAGGVPAGTVYAVGAGPSTSRVTMYVPDGEGGLEFAVRWEVRSTESGSFDRCGPWLGTELKEGDEVAIVPCPPNPSGSRPFMDVDVSQATGNVYVQLSIQAAGKAIALYSPDGSEEITRFGEIAPDGKKTAEAPELIHNVAFPGGIAVSPTGDVYFPDRNGGFDGFYSRIMKFQPKVPGQFDEYEYAGIAADVAHIPGVNDPRQPVTDAAGLLYVTKSERKIEVYDPSQPGDPPICQFEFKPAGIAGMTVDPSSGEVFFFSTKLPHRLRRLGPCDPGTGKFTELEPEPEAFTVAPERGDLWALAFDPVRQLDPSRPAGVLYGGAPDGQPLIGPGEPGQGSLGYIFTRAKEVPPVVEAQSFAHVGTTGALLRATINPNGFATNYRFQYLSAVDYEANPPSDRFAGALEAPLGGGELSGDGGARGVSSAIGGLDPDTAYRFRVVATSSCAESQPLQVCEDSGEALGFRTFVLDTSDLPDGRAYELVSPAQKNGGQVYPLNPRLKTFAALPKPGLGIGRFPMQSSPDGEAIAYEGTAFSLEGGASNQNSYVARRTASGWQSTNPTPPLLESRESTGGYRAFSTDLAEAIVRQTTGTALSSGAPPGIANLYSQPLMDPLGLAPLVEAAPPGRTNVPGNEFQVEYAGAAGDLSRVFFRANDALTGEVSGIAPAAEDGGASKFNLYEWERDTGQLRLVNVGPSNAETEAGASFGAGSANAVSDDGRRAFWSDASGQLFVREGAESTLEIPDAGKFLSAATDGSKVLLDNGHLYDLETEATTDLTDGKGGFQGIAGQSDDLSHVYFVATEVLTGEEANSEGAKAEVGKPNLYAWNEGTTRFVATLLGGSEGDNNPNSPLNGLSSDWVPSPTDRSAKASPNGRYLAFLSKAPLTGYDSTAPTSSRCRTVASGNPPTFGPGPCAQAFVYDANGGDLACVSCNPTGAAPLSWAQLPVIEGPPSLPQPNFILDSGRLYFDSGDSLTQFDTNEGTQDVYQWEPDGAGGCKRAAGCLDLISAGREAGESNFVAADESGKNVFFTTRDKLLLKDKDELIDLYVAREGGGIAAETETQRPQCQGEACQPAASPPNDPTPASSNFQGPGNIDRGVTKPRCPKGRKAVRRKGKTRCVKRGPDRSRAANRNRGGAK